MLLRKWIALIDTSISFRKGKLPPRYFEISEANMIAWIKTSNHIGGNLPRFICEFRKGGFSIRKKTKNFTEISGKSDVNTTCRKLDQIWKKALFKFGKKHLDQGWKKNIVLKALNLHTPLKIKHFTGKPRKFYK